MKIQKIAKKWLKLHKIYGMNLITIFLTQIHLGLRGSEAAIAVFRPVKPGSNRVEGKEFFKLVGLSNYHSVALIQTLCGSAVW